ncbi:MAG: hypothetical protein LUC90_09285 [Lachnospiraceae bacterium]|nr:hypothetical protein [Lachnospiraceae bacterium]
MKRKNVYHLLPEYIRASGDLALKFYKEEIEAAMRTNGLGGFELLSLTDYPGQCTATVGMLDAFFDSKGITTPEEFSSFASSVVPLWKSRRIFVKGETLNAELALYDYSEERNGLPASVKNQSARTISELNSASLPRYHECKADCPVYEIKIMIGNNVFFEAVTQEPALSISLDNVNAPAILKVSVTVNGHTNRWNLFVMENLKDTPCPEYPVPILRADSDELQRLIADGGQAIVTAEGLADTIEGSFEPVFWSPAFFPSGKTCGMIVDHTHPVFRSFPTEHYTDFQWRKPVIHSKNMDISAFPEDFTPIVEPVPNFYDNTRRSPLFEARVGNADLLFCGFDLAREDDTSRQLKRSILECVSSGNFHPAQTLCESLFE